MLWCKGLVVPGIVQEKKKHKDAWQGIKIEFNVQN